MQNPFTTTFSKAPEYTYISTEVTSEILENFSYPNPSESVFKITGVRGSGKTVVLAKVEEALSSEDAKSKGWLVYRLSPARDLLGQLASSLSKDGFSRKGLKNKSINVSATVLGTGGGFGYSSTRDDVLFDIGTEIDAMLQLAQKAGKRILIGIDEVSKSREMVVFASEFGRWLRAGFPVFLVCTGLYENVQELCNVKNLTFFRRATTVKTRPLNEIKMSEMYRTKLQVDLNRAKEMASMTMGYAYAFQELGVLYFKKHEEEDLLSVVSSLKAEIFAYSYEKIWEELSEGDRTLVRLLCGKKEYKREELLALLGEKASGYSVYRDRLLNRGLISARQGYISLGLPFFAEYVRDYCL